MVLSNAAGSETRLTIAGYQFPHEAEGEWDANWLLIHVKATSSEGSWSVVDPCLTTWEVERLASWLAAIQAGQPKRKRCSFTEPNLIFEYPEGEPSRIRIYFKAELRQPWAKDRSVGQEDQWIDFPQNEIDLSTAIASLREQLARFPGRGARSRM